MSHCVGGSGTSQWSVVVETYTFVVVLWIFSKERSVVNDELYHVECVPVFLCEIKDFGISLPAIDLGELD